MNRSHVNNLDMCICGSLLYKSLDFLLFPYCRNSSRSGRNNNNRSHRHLPPCLYRGSGRIKYNVRAKIHVSSFVDIAIYIILYNFLLTSNKFWQFPDEGDNVHRNVVNRKNVVIFISHFSKNTASERSIESYQYIKNTEG